MDPNPYDYELGTLKQLCRTANKTANRTTWRLAMLGRSVCVQVTIRGATSAVPGGVASRAPMGWVITTPASSKPAVTIESKTRGRTLRLPRSRRHRGYAAIFVVAASLMNFNSNSIGLT